MTYKSINTCIDDLFAIVIKMSIVRRLACLRDDVVFFVFYYQWWRYRTYYTRVNESRQCEESTEDLLEELRVKKKEGVGKEEDEGKERRRICGVAEGEEEAVAVEEKELVDVGTKRRSGARDKRNRS